jgi:hypothetical protein
VLPPRLVIGITAPRSLAEGTAAAVVRRLRLDPRLPADVEVRQETGLLRLLDVLRGRGHVVLVDAAQNLPGAGRPFIHDEPLPFAHAGHGDGREISAQNALVLLRLSDPTLNGVRFSWVLLPAQPGVALPDELVADGVEAVLALLGA